MFCLLQIKRDKFDKKAINLIVDCLSNANINEIQGSYRDAASIWGQICKLFTKMSNNLKNRKLFHGMWKSNRYRIRQLTERQWSFLDGCLRANESYMDSLQEIHIKHTTAGKILFWLND